MTVANSMPKTGFDANRKMISEGAYFIDLGACSTQPGAEEISEEEEKKRLFTILEKLIESFYQTVFFPLTPIDLA